MHTFNELLANDGSFKIHDRNLQKLLIEIFKVKMKLAPEIMNEVFDFIECGYPLRNELRFKSRNICTARYGIETAAFVGSRIWANMPIELNLEARKLPMQALQNLPSENWLPSSY